MPGAFAGAFHRGQASASLLPSYPDGSAPWPGRPGSPLQRWVRRTPMGRGAWQCVIGLAGAVLIPAFVAASQAPSELQKFNGAWVLNRQQSTSAGSGGGEAATEGGG